MVLNPAPARPVSPTLLPLIDLLAPNETEAAALSGRPVASRQDAIAAAHALRDMGAGAVLMTLGGDGAIYCDGTGLWHCPPVMVEPVDTTAAGDAYLGAFAAARAEGQTLLHCLGIAAAAAAIAVTRAGAQPSLPSRQELDAFLARYGLPLPQPLPA